MNETELFLDGGNLPNKLSNEELIYLFGKVYIGDKNTKKKIFEHNIKLVLYRVEKRFKNIEYDKKEYEEKYIVKLYEILDILKKEIKN